MKTSSSKPAKPAEGKPNVVFIFSDDQRFDTIHTLGNPAIKTPNLDRLAREGVAFRNHYFMGGTWGAVYVPSRNMMLTGRTLFHLAPPDEPSPATYKGGNIPREHVMVPEQFRKHGYRTFMTGKWHNGGSARRAFVEIGWSTPGADLEPKPVSKPSGHFACIPRAQSQTGGKISGKHCSEIFANDAVEFIEKQSGRQPFFLYLAFHAPHDPIMAPPEYEALYSPEKIPLPPSFSTSAGDVWRPHEVRLARLHGRDHADQRRPCYAGCPMVPGVSAA